MKPVSVVPACLAVLLAAALIGCTPARPPVTDDQNIRHAQDTDTCARQPDVPWCSQ
jgi:hypothetical protein